MRDYYLSSVNKCAQFTMWWVNADKLRPCIVVSNDWFNACSKGVLVAMITSVDKSDQQEKEFGQLLIPFINSKRYKNYIKLDRLMFVEQSELINRCENSFIGVLTNESVKQKIINIMTNICNPSYNQDRLNFIENTMHKEITDTNTDLSDDYHDINRIFIYYTLTCADIERLLPKYKCYEPDAIDIIKTKKFVDDNNKMINVLMYIMNTPKSELVKKCELSQSTITNRIKNAVKYSLSHGFISQDAYDFILKHINKRKGTTVKNNDVK